MTTQEKLICVAEDCPKKKGTPPVTKKQDAIVLFEYDELINNPYKYTYDELKHQVHIVRRGKKEGELKLDAYTLTRGQLPKKWGWGIHINQNEKLALVGCETIEYQQFINNDSVIKTLAIRSSGSNNKEKSLKTDESTDNNFATSKYWLYSPGENAECWEEFYKSGIMGLGWEDLGDLANYQNKAEIVKKLQELEDTTGSKKNDATANFEFKEVVSVGDTVIVKKGRGELLGYGQVASDYYFDKNREQFKKCRKVEWQLKGVWKTNHKLVLKTLTDITRYPSDKPNFEQYYDELMALMTSPRNYEKPFKQWLERRFKDDSGTKHSYVVAIHHVSQVTGHNIFESDNLEVNK